MFVAVGNHWFENWWCLLELLTFKQDIQV